MVFLKNSHTIALIMKIFKKHPFGLGFQAKKRVKTIQRHFLKHQLSLSVAESCTGGELSSLLNSLPGSSQFFKGGLVAYSTDIKERVLGIQKEDIKRFGFAGEGLATLMAQKAQGLFQSDWSLSVTGFASPDLKNPSSEAGKVAFALCSPSQTHSQTSYFKGEREAIRRQAVLFAFDFLLSQMK